VRHPCQRSLPGPVATDLRLGEHGVAETVARATGVDADTARKTFIAGIGGFATGRLTTPEEVATLITFLASGRAANITDANYPIDSGLIKQPEARACLHSSPQLTGSGADHAGDERRNPRGVPGPTTALHGSTEQVFCAPFGRARGAFASSK
jgi:hypothetical protein